MSERELIELGLLKWDDRTQSFAVNIMTLPDVNARTERVADSKGMKLIGRKAFEEPATVVDLEGTLQDIKEELATRDSAMAAIAIFENLLAMPEVKLSESYWDSGQSRLKARKAKIENALYEITGDRMRVDFEVIPELNVSPNPQRPKSLRQKMREKEKHPFVRRAIELFDAEVVRFEGPSAEE